MLTELTVFIFTVSPMDGHKWQIARSEPAGGEEKQALFINPE